MNKMLMFIGIVIFIYILVNLDFIKLKEHINNINYFYLVFAFILNIPMVFFKSLRWKKILETSNINISYEKSFEYYMSSLYLGFISPGRIGEFSRLIYIKKLSDKNYGYIFSSVILDRLFDLYLLVVLTLVAFLYFNINNIQYISIILFVFFILPFLIIRFKIVDIMINFIANKLKNKIIDKSLNFVEDFRKGFKASISNNIIIFLLFTISSYLIFFIQTYLIVLSLNLSISFITISLIMAISNTISLLPISISGIGIRDLILIYLFGNYGIDKEIAVMYSSFVFLVFFVGCAVIGLYFFNKNPINLK
jgi:uncharacterized protein (TIRG00374 family)